METRKQIQYLTAEDLQHLQHNSWWLHSTICSIVSLTLNGPSNCIMPNSVCDNIPEISLETLFCHYGHKSQITTHNGSDLHNVCLILKTPFPFRHHCRWIRHTRWSFLIIWFLLCMHDLIVTAVSKQSDLINLENAKKNTFWMIYLYIIIGVNSVMLITSSMCCKVLLSVKSDTAIQHLPEMSHKFKLNVYGIFVCQITLVFCRECYFVNFAFCFFPC